MRFMKSLLTLNCGYARRRRMSQREACALTNSVGRYLIVGFVGFLLFISGPAIAQEFKNTYPRIGAYEIGSAGKVLDPEYRQVLAKHDILILGMWRNWQGTDIVTGEQYEMRDIVVDIKRRAAAMGNDGILVGKYTVFNESGYNPSSSATSDKREKLFGEIGPGYPKNNDWWARDKNGENTSSWPGTWNINVTEFVRRDSNGDTWPEWLANRDFGLFFRDIPEFDIWYIDNWFFRPRVTADWNGDGVNDDPKSETLGRAYRQGFMNGLRRIHQLAPNKIVMGNVDGDPYANNGMLNEPEFNRQLTSLFEAAIGHTWSVETWGTWEAMMDQYQITLANSQHRLLLMTVNGEATDYATMRYGLTSCLMDDGHYYYTTFNTEYKSGLWFDEYDVDLGLAIDPPQFGPWQSGVYRRRFQNGMVLVNPKGNGRRTLQIEAGYKRISGTQDTATNNGQPVSSLVLEERDGIILLSDQVPDNQVRPKPPILE